MRLICKFAVYMLLASLPLSSHADIVADWNNLLLNSIRTGAVNPPRAARAMAIVHTAMFDAVNSIDRHYSPYHFSTVAPPATSREAAAAQAAHDTLVDLFPGQAATFAATLNTQLLSVPDGGDKSNGIGVGSAAAASILALRNADHANDVVPYVPGSGAGDWRPTPPANAPALLPNWPQVTPWTMTSGSQYRDASGPPALGTSEYADALAEVRDLGAVNSPTRTAEQTQIATFWADGGGTATPPGHWNLIAQEVVDAKGLSLVESARTFALLNLGMADASIVSWDNKYAFNFWRPITAIREDSTSPDPDWSPLITTPPFPSYTSGHSTYSGAASAILGELFGDATSFASAQDGNAAIVRSFTSFSHAAAEAADSRLFGGIHFRFDNDDGLLAGSALGARVASSFLQPVPEPSVFAVSGIALCFSVQLVRLIRERPV